MVRLRNILWIVTTQWRAQAVGYAGDVNARTPHLDRLATEGMNFSQAVTPHPFGPFARAAMLTGRRSPENGLSDYFDPLPVGTRTIAHDLTDRGYETAFFGKWHLGQRDPRAPLVGDAHAKTIIPEENRGGFQFWEGFESGFLLNEPWLHGTRLPAPQRFDGYQSDVLCRRAGDYLGAGAHPFGRRRGDTDAPWFGVVSLEAPHPPYDAPSADVLPTEVGKIILRSNVPRGGSTEEKARREMAGYYAHIEATDRAIGRLLESVREAKPMVVFTSVHGDMHGSHGLFRKGWPYEESVRVPLLVKGWDAAEAFSNERPPTISLTDLRELTLACVDQRTPTWDQRHSHISMPSAVPLPHQCDRPWRGIRTPSRKLVLTAEGKPWLFFDLERDPCENENLVDDPNHATELQTLRTTLESLPTTSR